MKSRPFINPGYAAAVAAREAAREREVSTLRAKVASQQSQIIELRKQLSASVNRARRAQASEAAE